MSTLAFDTCLGAVSAALGRCAPDGTWTVVEAWEARETGHAERLMPMLAELLAGAGITPRDLRRIAVTLGPGSFTGVRSGLAAARAFRLAASLDVVGTTSLAVIAQRAFTEAGGRQQDRRLLVAVDARRDRLYAQLFGSDAHDALTPPVEVAPDEALGLAGSGPLLLAGSGAAAIQRAAGRREVDIVGGSIEPRATDLLALADRLLPLEHVLPIYIRPPDAKPQAGQPSARLP